MPTTRKKRKSDNADLLPGLPKNKKAKSPPSIMDSVVVKPTAKKSKKKKEEESEEEPELPCVALATQLLEQGDLRDQGPFYQNTPGEVKRWEHRKDPITNPDRVPEGWFSHEPDLKEDDIDGQIERCHVRLQENIMPIIFEHRLEYYEGLRNHKLGMMRAEPERLSWEVVQRLDILKKIQKSLEEHGDSNKNSPNVSALMAAYRSKKLEWFGDDTVTYWAHGKMIEGPKKIDMKELLALSAQTGTKGFWVEGMGNCEPEHCHLFMSIPPGASLYAMHYFEIAVRNPNTWRKNTDQHTLHLHFLDDTGATNMRLYARDRWWLEQASGAPLPIVSHDMLQTVAGMTTTENVVVQANILINGQAMLPRWVDVKVNIPYESPGTGPSGPRLSGLWFRHLLYTWTLPNNTGRMHVGNDMTEMLGSVPLTNPAYAIPPPIHP